MSAISMKNKTNGKEKEVLKTLDEIDAVIFNDNINRIKYDNIAQCMNDRELEELKSCFNGVEWLEVEKDGVTYVTTATATTRTQNRLEFIRKNGYDPEDEKDDK